MLRILVASIWLGRQPDPHPVENGTAQPASKRPMIEVLHDLVDLFKKHVEECSLYKIPFKVC